VNRDLADRFDHVKNLLAFMQAHASTWELYKAELELIETFRRPDSAASPCNSRVMQSVASSQDRVRRSPNAAVGPPFTRR
jgi:hypothetical protein